MTTASPAESREAFAQAIMKEHRRRLLLFLARRGIPLRDREDLFQEVAHAACDAREAGERPRSVWAWLCGIAKNKANHYTHRPHVRREQLTEDADTAACDIGPGLEEILMHRDRVSMLLQMLDSMPEPDRRAFVMHRMEGSSLLEVAEAEGINPNTAAWRVRRGEEHCRAWLERWKATERRKGRDGEPIVLVPLLDETEAARRDSVLSRLSGRVGRGFMRVAVALLALGCMSPVSRDVLVLEPMPAVDVVVMSGAAPSAPAPESPAGTPPAPEATSTQSAGAEAGAPPSSLDSDVLEAPKGGRTSAERRRDAAEIMVLQAEAELNAGNDAAALRLIMEHGERGPGGKATERRSKLLREIKSR